MKQVTWLWIALTIALIGCRNNSSLSGDNTLQYPELKEINAAIEKAPTNASLYFKRGKILHQLTQDSLALKDFLHAVSIDSSQAAYHSAIGELLFNHKDITGSVKWIEQAVKLNPTDEIAHLKLAHVFLYTEEYPKAFTEINTVLRTNVYNPEAYFLKGMCYKGLKDTGKAISSFQTAVEVNPKYADAFLQLALLHEAKKNPLALSYFENAYKADTSNLEPLYGKAMYWQNQGNFTEAKKIFNRIVGINRQYPKSYYNTGWMLLQEDSTEKAIRMFTMALDVKPDYADAFFNRGLCYEIRQDIEKAIFDYNQALNLQPDNNAYQQALQRAQQKNK